MIYKKACTLSLRNSGISIKSHSDSMLSENTLDSQQISGQGECRDRAHGAEIFLGNSREHLMDRFDDNAHGNEIQGSRREAETESFFLFQPASYNFFNPRLLPSAESFFQLPSVCRSRLILCPFRAVSTIWSRTSLQDTGSKTTMP